jgi:AraC-like DNA-binding protein
MKSFFRHLFHRGIPRAQKQLDARIGAAVSSWVQGRSYVKNLPTLEEIAGDIGVPSDQLSAYIHVHERRHVLAWRKDLRIRDAMELLRSNPELPVSVVGEMVGIPDKSNFKRQFAELAGMSPREWRERHAG